MERVSLTLMGSLMMKKSEGKLLISHTKLDLKTDEDDVINLIESHRQPHSNEDLMELDREKALFSKEEEPEVRLLETKDLHALLTCVYCSAVLY